MPAIPAGMAVLLRHLYMDMNIERENLIVEFYV